MDWGRITGGRGRVDLHLKDGNIGMADGSAQQPTIAGLQTALTAATNSAPDRDSVL